MLLIFIDNCKVNRLSDPYQNTLLSSKTKSSVNKGWLTINQLSSVY
jgi:hypothetical protein